MVVFINIIVALIGYRVNGYDFLTLYCYISISFDLFKVWNKCLHMIKRLIGDKVHPRNENLHLDKAPSDNKVLTRNENQHLDSNLM